MNDRIILCKRCGGDLCYENTIGAKKINNCLGCGFTSHNDWIEKNEEFQAQFETLPQLYQDLKFLDIENKIWIPQTINSDKGIIFADGTSKNSYFWTAMKLTEVKEEEKDKFKKKDTDEYFKTKVDISTKKSFGQKGFMDAMEYLGLFNVNQTEYGI